MKNALLALCLFAFAGTAHEGDKAAAKGKKKEACSTEMAAKCAKPGTTAGTPSCCMKKAAKTAAVTPAPAVKSL